MPEPKPVKASNPDDLARASNSPQPLKNPLGVEGSTPPPMQTVLDQKAGVPGVTVPGDGPHDTTDPTERATSVPFLFDEQAIAEGRANAVVPLMGLPPKVAAEPDRMETYETPGPDGAPVKVQHNLDTGETQVG